MNPDNKNQKFGQGKSMDDGSKAFVDELLRRPVTGESVIESDDPLVPLAPSADLSLLNDIRTWKADYLSKLIGHTIKVQMQFGCNCQLIDRAGVLVEVGKAYIVLETCWHDYLVCDLDAIKLIVIYR